MSRITQPYKKNADCKPLTWFLDRFFQLLYHQLSWSYDLIAWIVSVGQWKQWIKAIIPYTHGPLILELGHGPGHLQCALNQLEVHHIGLDLSRDMGRKAHRNLTHLNLPTNLIQAKAQQLPFSINSLSQIVSTFPSDFICDPQTFCEIDRVLVPGGSAIIILSARITGNSLFERLAAWLNRVTGQSPVGSECLISLAINVKLSAHAEIITLPRSELLLLQLHKPG